MSVFPWKLQLQITVSRPVENIKALFDPLLFKILQNCITKGTDELPLIEATCQLLGLVCVLFENVEYKTDESFEIDLNSKRHR